MTDKISLKATHSGSVVIGSLSLPCFVLEDGTRVLSERGVLGSFGMTAGARDTKEKLPRYLRGKNVVGLIDQDLKEKLSKPIWFKFQGEPIRKGVQAYLLPDICNVWLKARDAGILIRNQLDTAKMADILIRGLAHIGIIALVDEATGYQDIRRKDALQKILDAYLLKELAAWAKKFPDEFYDEMFRLRGWNWNSLKRPSYVGKLTNDIVYERLAPGLVEELQKRNPKNEKGARRGRHHQLLTDEIGHPALAQHLHAIMGFMRASAKWDDFYRLLQRAFPKKNDQLSFLMDID